MNTVWRLFKLSALVLTAFIISACGQEKIEFLGNDITGSGVGKDLEITDTSGKLRTIDDYKGKVTLFFFGFTQCPDVCPTALFQLAQAVESLEDDADKVQVLMISVDPDRDTPEILSEYVAAFDSSFKGLVGTHEQLQKTARSFKAFYQKVPGSNPEHYTMDHSASFYLFDKDAKVRALIPGSTPADEIAIDIKKLL